jgi:hypothetical protein
VVGVPQQRSRPRAGLDEGMASRGGLDIDDAPGPVADCVGESARRRVRSQVVNGRIDGARRSLQAATHKVTARAVAGRGDRQVINGPHQPVAGHGERIGRQEARVPEGGDRRPPVSGQREQPAPSYVLRRAILVMRDDRTFPAPGQVAAADTPLYQAEVTPEVQQRQVVKRHRRPLSERGQLGPFRAVARRGGLAHGGQPIAPRRARDMAAQPGQGRPGLRQRGELAPDVLAEGTERLPVRAGQHDPAKTAQPVLIQCDAHILAPRCMLRFESTRDGRRTTEKLTEARTARRPAGVRRGLRAGVRLGLPAGSRSGSCREPRRRRPP